jgi:hypothetical protein
MKKTVLAILMVMAMCFNCFGDELQSYSDQRHQMTLENQLYDTDFVPDEYDNAITIPPSQIFNKEEVIKHFIQSGDVCEAVGHHQWIDWFALPTYRECSLCNKLQRENTAPKWVDVQ